MPVPVYWMSHLKFRILDLFLERECFFLYPLGSTGNTLGRHKIIKIILVYYHTYLHLVSEEKNFLPVNLILCRHHLTDVHPRSPSLCTIPHIFRIWGFNRAVEAKNLKPDPTACTSTGFTVLPTTTASEVRTFQSVLFCWWWMKALPRQLPLCCLPACFYKYPLPITSLAS